MFLARYLMDSSINILEDVINLNIIFMQCRDEEIAVAKVKSSIQAS